MNKTFKTIEILSRKKNEMIFVTQAMFKLLRSLKLNHRFQSDNQKRDDDLNSCNNQGQRIWKTHRRLAKE